MPNLASAGSSGGSPSLICHIYFTAFNHESRARRGVDAVLAAGLADRAEAIGYRIDDQKPREQITDNYAVRRFAVDIPFPLPRLIGRSFSWLLWSFLTVIALVRRRPKLIQVHAIAALPAGVFAKWLTGSKILYDAHDLETERTGWTPVQRRVSKWMERLFIGQVDGMIVVSDMIADWYEREYKMPRPALVRNIPIVSTRTSDIDPSEPSLRRALGLTDDDFLYIYIGAIGDYRGIELLIDAFAQLPPNYHFCTLGYGDLVETVEAAAARYPNIHHHPAIPGAQVPLFVRDADVGTCILEDVSMNHRLTLPNKLFETRHGGLAALVSDLPAIKDFVDRFGGGWSVAHDVDAVVNLIRSIDKAEIQRVMKTAKPIPTWDEEVQVFLAETRRALG